MAAMPFTVERSAVVRASPDAIYPLLVDFHQWPRWSPWEDLDPQMQRTYGGPDRGVGATYSWQGNRKAGSGSMEITDTTEPTDLGLRLVFVKPFPADNRITFELRPEGSGTGSGTRVTWRMTGEASGVMRLFARFGAMDRMVGKDFDKGLARLSAQVS